jgi:hypothetical protein
MRKPAIDFDLLAKENLRTDRPKSSSMADMADKIRAFLAILMGAILLLNLNLHHYPIWSTTKEITEDQWVRVINWEQVNQALLGVVLLAGGLAHVWTRSRFYRGKD